MDHYTKTCSGDAESEEKKEPCDIHVKSGSKIRNIIAQASRMLQVYKLILRLSSTYIDCYQISTKIYSARAGCFPYVSYGSS